MFTFLDANYLETNILKIVEKNTKKGKNSDYFRLFLVKVPIIR